MNDQTVMMKDYLTNGEDEATTAMQNGGPGSPLPNAY